MCAAPPRHRATARAARPACVAPARPRSGAWRPTSTWHEGCWS